MKTMPFTRLRREVETRWVPQYVAQFYPKFPVRFRCPLGPVPPELTGEVRIEKAIKIARPWRPEVDALVIKPDELVLIEGKIWKYMDGLSKLPFYKSMVPKTPELKDHWGKSIRMELILPVEIPWVIEYAKGSGVEVKIWGPDWVLDIWREKDIYWQKPAVEVREHRKEILRRLGYA